MTARRKKSTVAQLREVTVSIPVTMSVEGLMEKATQIVELLGKIDWKLDSLRRDVEAIKLRR